MLFRNDSKYELTSEDYKKMAEFIGCDSKGTKFEGFPKAGIVVKYPKSAFTINPDNPHRPDRPSMLTILYEEHLETISGTEKWNYCKRPPVVKQGETPNYGEDTCHLYSQRFFINQNQPDFLFYLICICRSGSHVKEVKKAMYEIENKKREAQQSNNKRSLKINVEAQIFHPTARLHDDDIARIAKAMRVDEVDTLDKEQVRDSLITKIESMEASTHKNGYKTFMDLVDATSPAGSRVDLLAGLQMLKDKKIIKYHGVSNKWVTININGKSTGTICPLSPNKTPDESLEHHAMTDPDIGEQIARLIRDAEKIPMPQE